MLSTLITVALVISTSVTLILVNLPVPYQGEQAQSNANKHDPAKTSVQILVLGDVGRSPRMQYHAHSVAKHGGRVQLIGYLDNEPLAELRAHSNVRILAIPTPPTYLQTSNRILFLLFGPLKVLIQLWSLWRVLGYEALPSRWLLVQNPPSIPTLLIATLICFVRNTRLVIDWHNFGYSILALKLGDRHPLVRVSRGYERWFAQFAYSHLTVTKAMKSVLQDSFVPSVPVLTLHDRPAPLFRPLTPSQRVQFLSQNFLTKDRSAVILDRKTRLLVSSTSWTPDEDFSVLLKALCLYSAKATSSAPQLPELLVLITGKGPQRQHYLEEIARLEKSGELEMVTVKTAWLSFEDYASLLGAADLGVSLHTSSSGVDLPMKVVDMFGAGLPVLGFDNFQAWPELVTEDVNGKGFTTGEQMADILEELFEPGHAQLEVLRKGAIEESKRRWDSEWDPVAGRLFQLTN